MVNFIAQLSNNHDSMNYFEQCLLSHLTVLFSVTVFPTYCLTVKLAVMTDLTQCKHRNCYMLFVIYCTAVCIAYITRQVQNQQITL